MPVLSYCVLIVLYLSKTYCESSNIVLFLTDDQDLILHGMTPMKKTIELIANRGVTFKNAFVNAPICCPSRSTLLTGRLPHNTGVKNNSLSGNCVGTSWKQDIEPFSIAASLKQAGYTTFYAGKYLNQYGVKASGGVSHIPLGWQWWYGLVGNSRYYDYTLSENGTAHHYPNTYLTDLIKTKALDFLEEASLKWNPFFMVLSTPAPHAPFTPADRHSGKYSGTKALRTPAFNCTPLNKHWLLQMPPVHLPADVSKLDEIQGHRFETLLAVDEMVEAVVSKLSDIGELANTYIIYTSDNGYHIGQFGQPWDKRQPYDTDIRVPLLIRGPGLKEKVLSEFPTQGIDLAPTILQMAGLETPSYMDGQSFLSDLMDEKINGSPQFDKKILIEYHGEGNGRSNDPGCPWGQDNDLAECSSESWCKCQDSINNTYNCVRHLAKKINFMYCKMVDDEDFSEAYDLNQDIYQIKNIYSEMKEHDIQKYDKFLENLIQCKGRNCHTIK